MSGAGMEAYCAKVRQALKTASGQRIIRTCRGVDGMSYQRALCILARKVTREMNYERLTEVVETVLAEEINT